MRIVIGIDSSEQAFTDIEQPFHVFAPTDLTDSSKQTFAALQQTLHIFSPTDITFVHGVDLGRFEFPFGADAANRAEREQYEELRRAKLDAGRRLLKHAASLVPKDGPSTHQVCDVQTPARLILGTAKAVAADLIVTGTRGHGPVAEAASQERHACIAKQTHRIRAQ